MNRVISYSDLAIKDLEWFKKYYATHPQLGYKKAFDSFNHALDTIFGLPNIGVEIPGTEYRKYKIQKSRFSIYYIEDGRSIFIVRVKDNRTLPRLN